MSLTLSKIEILAADIGKESSMPSFAGSLLDQPFKNALSEDDELYLNFMPNNSAFPYRAQNNYSRELKKTVFDCVILENEYLKATFLPTFGGRLWSLADKIANRELLYKNSVLTFANLAVRNAWFSGGVEWNCAVRGHTPFTCSPIFVSVLKDENGEDVLRMYEYERIRCMTYQMDFSLPKGSKFLHARMRVVNTKNSTNSTYWWSNIAVRTTKGMRVIAPCDSAYTNGSNDYVVFKLQVPEYNGRDVTFPENTPESRDYFWNTSNYNRKYIAAVGQDGYGLLQFSSSRLKGRKLFVWGDTLGADHWQNYLSGNGDDGKYCEIQAGLAPTQYEGFPIAPDFAAEWVELYGAINTDYNKINGDYKTAQDTVENFVQDSLGWDYPEEFLKRSKAVALKKADKVLFCGSGFGALEQMRREKSGEKPMQAHLDFGTCGEVQKDWVCLLNTGDMPSHDMSEVPACWMRQEEWITLLKKAVAKKANKNAYAYLQLAYAEFVDGDKNAAKRWCEKSVSLGDSALGRILLGMLKLYGGDSKGFKEEFLIAAKLKRGDGSIIKFILEKFTDNEFYGECIDVVNSLEKSVYALPRVKFYYAKALAHTGNGQKALEILEENGGIEIPDMQECSTELSDLWLYIKNEQAKQISGAEIYTIKDVPYKFRFDMFEKNAHNN